MRIPFRQHHLLNALKEFDEHHFSLDLCLMKYFRTHASLGSKDRAFIAETIYALVRWKGLLDELISPPRTWEKRLDLFLNSSLDNLRSDSTLPSYAQVSFPEWLYQLLVNEYGEEKAKTICLISNTQAPPTIRANLLKTTRDELFESLSKRFPVEKTNLSPNGIVFKNRINFFEQPEFKNGLFEVQDEGSQLLAELMQPEASTRVLDYCSGSGGKTLAFAYKLKGKGQIYLHDIRKSALIQARKRLKRAGIQNAQFLEANHPNLKKLKKRMDWVLVDTPCSGTGTLRRNPDMKWKFSYENLQNLIQEQRKVFDEAIKFVKPGGKIVYGTCSLLQDENEKQAAYFLSKYPLKQVGEPLKLLPALDGHDGFYGIVFEILI